MYTGQPQPTQTSGGGGFFARLGQAMSNLSNTVDIKLMLKHQVYFPGNMVEGFVQVSANNPITFKAIRVKLTGKEKVKVIERRQERSEDGHRRIKHKQTVVIHKHLITLAGLMKTQHYGSFGNPEFTLPPGTYTYPFAFHLPINAPPSWNYHTSDDVGGIRYYVKGYVDIPMGRDSIAKEHFTVLQAIPKQQWLAPSGITQDKYWDVTCCCCIGKGKLSARLFCDRTTISIDRDQLVVCADVNNEEGEERVESFEISLINRIELSADGHRETVTRCISNTKLQGQKGSLAAGEKGRFIGTIPLINTEDGRKHFVPTVQGHIASSSYQLKLEMNIPNASDPEYEFPVIVSQSVDESNFLPMIMWNQASYARLMPGCPPLREDFYHPPPDPAYALEPIPNPYPMGWQPPPMPPQPQPYTMAPPVGMYGPPTGPYAQPGQPGVHGPQATQHIQWAGGTAYQPMQPPPITPVESGMGIYGDPSPYTPPTRGVANPGTGSTSDTLLLSAEMQEMRTVLPEHEYY